MRRQKITSRFLRGLLLLLLVPALLHAQFYSQGQPDKVAALKQSLADNQRRLAHYQWVETTIVSVKGDQKSEVQKACLYGPDGKVQKQQMSAPAEQSSPRGLRGRIVAKKKEEMTDYMQNAAALVHQYLPPESHRIQAAKDAGNIALKPGGGGVQLQISNYLKPGDMLTISLAGNDIQQIHIVTYLESPKDAITLDANFASLNDGTSYPGKIILVAPAKNIQIDVQNSNYRKMTASTQMQPAPQTSSRQQQVTTSDSTQEIDSLKPRGFGATMSGGLSTVGHERVGKLRIQTLFTRRNVHDLSKPYMV